MIYFLIAGIVVVLLAAVIMRIRRLSPRQMTPIALANQLLRQPERFFVIVPWYLSHCRQAKCEPLRFMEAAACQWKGMGNFDLPAATLVAFARLQSEPTRANLQNLLSLLFGETPNPLVAAAKEPGSNQHLAVKCLEVVNMAMTMSPESCGAAKKKLPTRNEINNLLQSAQEAEERKSKLTLRVFGDFDDDSILKQWRSLIKCAGTLIDPNYAEKFRSQDSPGKYKSSNAQIRKAQDKKRKKERKKKPGQGSNGEDDRHPSNQGYRDLWFIRHAVLRGHPEEGAEAAEESHNQGRCVVSPTGVNLTLRSSSK